MNGGEGSPEVYVGLGWPLRSSSFCEMLGFQQSRGANTPVSPRNCQPWKGVKPQG